MCETQLLLRRAKDADGQALGQLLSLYVNYLKLLASTHLDRRLKGRVSASDVVQETCFEAHRDFPQFSGESEREFLGWLRKILVHNLARLVERHVLAEKRDVRREISLNALGRAVEQSTIRLEAVLMDPQRSPSSQAVQRESVAMLADELLQLPEDYRQVLILRNLEGLPFGEVAARMDRSSGAVRMLWLRAIDALRQQFEAKGVL